MFSFSRENISIQLTFQMYDPAWEIEVDLDPEYIATDKDRLMLIVTPLMVDSVNSLEGQNTSEIPHSPAATSVSSIQTPSLQRSTRFSIVSSSEEEDNEVGMSVKPVSVDKTPCCSKSLRKRTRPNLLDDEDADLQASSLNEAGPDDGDEVLESHVLPLTPTSSNSSVTSAGVSKKLKKSEDPLPDPFPLPKNFRYDVEVALKAKRMSRETLKTFYSTVAGSMLQYKRYPTQQEYTRVAMEIIRKYPFLKPPVGSPTGSIVQKLVNRFKEFNRRKKGSQNVNPDDMKPEQNNSKQVEQTSKQGFVSSIPEIPSGEDEHSFQRHNNQIQHEWRAKKGKPNKVVLEKLADLSFAMRRRDILQNVSNLDGIYAKYPFLKDTDQLYLEMGRIFKEKMLHQISRENWNSTVPKVLEQVEVEKSSNSRLRTAMDILFSKQALEYDKRIAAACLLPYLLPESRTRPNHELIIFFCQDFQARHDIVAENGQMEPYVLVIGDLYQVEGVFLVIDKQIRYEIKQEDILFSLLSTFFVFNICYCKGTKNFFQYLEVLLLNHKHEKLNPSVSQFMALMST